MWACLGVLLNQKWTQPRLVSLIATIDGKLLGREDGSVGFDAFIGEFADFEQNLLGMTDVAGDLTDEENALLAELLAHIENVEESTSGETSFNLALDSFEQSQN